MNIVINQENALQEPPRKKLISIASPLYNEQAQVVAFVDSLLREVNKSEYRFEIILVDDGSSDLTWSEIETVSREHYVIRGIRLSRNFGKESALRAGIESAKGEAVITLDGDLQHPPELIHQMLCMWESGVVDIVEAIKTNRERDGLLVRLRASLFYSLFSSMTGFEMHGATDFKLLDKRVIAALRGMPERELFYRGMVAWLGFRVERIDFKVDSRASGLSKWRLMDLISYATSAITAFTSAPLYLIGMVGFILLLLSSIIGAKAIYLWFIGRSVPGYTTLLLIVMITGSCTMLALAIIGRYLSMIFNEIKQRPKYIIANETGGDNLE